MLKLISLPAQIAAKKAANHVKTSVDNVKANLKARETKLEAELAALTPQK
jgi:hypothetical protein